MSPEEQARIDAANQASQEAGNIPDEPQNVEPEQPVESAAQEPVEQVVNNPVDPPVAEPQTVEDDDEDPIPTFNVPQVQPVEPQPVQPQYQQPQYQQPAQQGVPQLNPQDFADEYGNVDVAKFTQAMQARDAALAQQVAQAVSQQVLQQSSQQTSQQLLAMRQEERAWQKAETKYPELKNNKELRDLVHNTRINYLDKGSRMSPSQAADKLFKFIQGAEQRGQAQATETVRVQAVTTHLETASNTASESAVRARENATRIGSSNRREARAAREDLIKDWIKNNQIQLPS